MVDGAALVQEQQALAARVRVLDDHPQPREVAGFDVAYDGDTAHGALDPRRRAVLESPTGCTPPP